jgi:hypothetical protein
MAEPTNPMMQDISRQRKLSEMLLQQGMQGSKGQMVGNIYVPSHPLENIADAFAIYKSGKLSKEANARELELAKQLRETQSLEAQDILGALRGSPEVKETTYGAGMEGPTVDFARPAVAGSPQAALAVALKGQSPFAQTMASKLMEQQFKQPKWEKVEQYDQKTGNTITGMVDVNSSSPESTFRPIGVSKPAMSAKDIADLRDRGINIGGVVQPGAPNVAPMAGGQGGTVVAQGGAQPNQGTSSVSFNMPTYQYNPNLSPAQNRELAGKFEADLQKNAKNAKESFNVIKDAADIFNTGAPTSGGFKNIGTGIAEFFDIPTQAADADAKLTILGEKLTAQVPRFEGPQSDKDTAAYRAAAGDLGNANKTITTRMSALKTLIDLNKKYYPQGEWDKIDLSGPVKTKQTFLSGSKTMSPTEFRKGLKGQDQEAFDWARRNPNDPRATEIRNRLGF